jgi:hypothetical protein
MTPRSPADWPTLIESVRESGNAAFFCDNCVYDYTAPDDLWEALLATPERLVMTPNVWRELHPWLIKHPDHGFVRAYKGGGSAGLTLRNPPEEGAPGRKAYDYYVALLALRHDTLDRMRRVFRKENGREPNSDEEKALAADVQKAFGPRGFLLANKPAGRLTDETLVYLAVEHALSTGRPTVVLTKDADVEEHFFKLLWLIETHYRGMLLADRYAKMFSQFRFRAFPERLLSHPAFPFEPENAVLIERDPDMRDILPAKSRFVSIECIYIGKEFGHMAFGAEREMNRLLRIKDETGGLNTDRLGGRNLHASVSPLPLGGTDCAAVAHDRWEFIQPNGPAVPKLDVLLAISTQERHATVFRMAVSPLDQPDTRWRQQLLG